MALHDGLELDLTDEARAYVKACVDAMPPATAEQIAATNALLRPYADRAQPA